MIDVGGLARRRMVLEWRYLEACNEYSRAGEAHLPQETALATMEQAECALADIERVWAAPVPLPQRRDTVEHLPMDTESTTDLVTTRTGKELAREAERARGKPEEADEVYQECPTCHHKVLVISTKIGECPTCHREVLVISTGMDGVAHVTRLDADSERQRTYVIAWDRDKKRYDCYESAAYPEHRCQTLRG